MSFNPLAAIFANRAANAANAPAPQPAPNGAVPTSGPAQGSNIPAFTQSTTEAPKPQSAMAEYGDLFTIPKVEGDAAPTLSDPFLTIDMDQVREFASKQSFVSNTPEMQALAAKAISGDAQAYHEYNNAMMRDLYVNIMATQSKVSEKIARTGVERLRDTIPNTIRSISTSNTLQTKNPIFNDPAAKPVVDMIRSQVELKNPTLTPDQVTEQVSKYFTDFAGALNPKAKVAETTNPYGGSTDYENFFNS